MAEERKAPSITGFRNLFSSGKGFKLPKLKTFGQNQTPVPQATLDKAKNAASLNTEKLGPIQQKKEIPVDETVKTTETFKPATTGVETGATGTEGQLAALGRQQPTQPTTDATTPSKPAFEPSPQDSQIKALRDKIVGVFKPSAREKELQESLNRILTGEELGQESIRTQAIPTGLIRGQAAALERQAGIQATPLQRQLALLQQGRVGEGEAAEAALGFREEDVEREAGQSIANLVSQGITDPAKIAAQLPGVDIAQIGETLKSLGVGDADAQGFTLAPGQMRFDAEGNIIASGGPKPQSEAQIQKAIDASTASAEAKSSASGTVAAITSILALEDSIGSISGPIRTTIGNKELANRMLSLQSVLTLPNLDKLKGSMSDKDLEFVKSAASVINPSIDEKGKSNLPTNVLIQELRNIRGMFQLQAGVTPTALIFDPASGETERFIDVTREEVDAWFAQGLIVDFE